MNSQRTPSSVRVSVSIMRLEIFADVRAEAKPIIVDDDDRRGWPEADPAVAQERTLPSVLRLLPSSFLPLLSL